MTFPGKTSLRIGKTLKRQWMQDEDSRSTAGFGQHWELREGAPTGNEVDWDYPVSDKQRGPSLRVGSTFALLIHTPSHTDFHIHTHTLINTYSHTHLCTYSLTYTHINIDTYTTRTHILRFILLGYISIPSHSDIPHMHRLLVTQTYALEVHRYLRSSALWPVAQLVEFSC